MTQTLPRLLDCKTLAAELGLTEYGAQVLMQKLPKVAVGRRVYVSSEVVRNYLNREART